MGCSIGVVVSVANVSLACPEDPIRDERRSDGKSGEEVGELVFWREANPTLGWARPVEVVSFDADSSTVVGTDDTSVAADGASVSQRPALFQ